MDKKLIDTICAKDDKAAKAAATKFINKANLKNFEYLCEKFEFLFDFVRENVYNRFNAVINKENFKNIFNFLEIYSPYFDEFFSSIFAKYANEELTDEIFELLINGNTAQKTYAAAYFKKIPDTVAIEELTNNTSSDFEPLFLNCAAALGKMEDKNTLNIFKTDLKSNDEFIKLRAVKFIISYGAENLLEELIKILKTSSMAENIAGEIVNMISPLTLLQTDFKKGSLLFSFLINGLGEILPLDNVFYYEIYDIFEFLAQKQCPESSLLLLAIKNKFNTFTQNEEYIFDLDKNTKNEIFEINKLTNSKNQEFWTKQRQNLSPLLNENCELLNITLDIIKDENYTEFIEEIANLTKSKNETIICKAVMLLKDFNALDKIDKNDINVKNSDLKAFLNQLF